MNVALVRRGDVWSFVTYDDRDEITELRRLLKRRHRMYTVRPLEDRVSSAMQRIIELQHDELRRYPDVLRSKPATTRGGDTSREGPGLQASGPRRRLITAPRRPPASTHVTFRRGHVPNWFITYPRSWT